MNSRKLIHLLSLLFLAALFTSCTEDQLEDRHGDSVSISADDYLATVGTEVLFGKIVIDEEGSWSHGWIINEQGELMEVTLNNNLQPYHKNNQFMTTQLEVIRANGKSLLQLEDKDELVSHHRNMSLSTRSLDAQPGSVYFGIYEAGPVESQGSCNSEGNAAVVVSPYVTRILAHNGGSLNITYVEECVDWLTAIDNQLN